MAKNKNNGTSSISAEQMEQIHRCGQELMDALAQICQENGLRYYVIAGTLLGAVRHNGPIPWDDDVDVCMPREDCERLKQIMLGRTDDGPYHIVCSETDPNFSIFILRLMKRGTVYLSQIVMDRDAKYKELWLDIFPLDNAPDKQGIGYRLHGAAVRFMKKCVANKGLRSVANRGPKGKVMHVVLLPFSLETLRKWTDKLIQRWADRDTNYFVSWGSHYHFLKQTMPKAWYEPATQVLYNGKYYRAPGQWDKVLTQLYGDYMTPPPKEERTGHGAFEVKF